MSKIIALLRLLRLHYHHNFIAVILGALCFSSTPLSNDLIIDIVFQYFAFGLCLYGGIYTLNALTDAEQDKQRSRKKQRPIPSGAVSLKEAKIVLISLWSLAFLSSYLYYQSPQYWPIYLAFIAVNLLYSLYLRGTRYRFLIGITCPMRFYLGAKIALATVPWTAYGIAFCFMCAVQLLKFNSETLRNTRGYRMGIASLLLVSCILGVWQYPDNLGFLLLVLMSYVIFIIAPIFFPILGVYLFGADVIAEKKTIIAARIFLALMKQRDIKGLCIFWLMFSLATLNRLLIAIEDMVLPQVSNIGFEKVVFILGHQRSGTTYLHKTLHRLPEVHTSSFYDLWCASIILKKLGRPLMPFANWITGHWSTRNHPINMTEELEEHFWLIIRFKSIVIPYIFPSLIEDFSLIQDCLTYTEEDFLFLKKCLQRVLYLNPSADVYVGRPLALTMNDVELRQYFPGAKFIVCTRNPVDILPSWVDHSANAMGMSPEQPEFKQFMKYSYKAYSQKIFRKIDSFFLESQTQPGHQPIYILLFEQIIQNIHLRLPAILSFIGLKVSLSELKAEESKKNTNHKNRTESYDIIEIENEDILSYRRNMEKIRQESSRLNIIGQTYE